MAEAPGDQAAVLDAVAAIQAATANAEQLTHHLLAFSRSDASLRVGVADLSEVVRLESKTLGRILPSNIQVTAEAVAPLFVPLSRGSLQEIIINMAINARDAMPKGGRLGLREPFFTTKPSGVGTGLGLSMVYGLVSGVGGTISVDSSPETGSRFTIRLPEIEAAQARDAASSKSGILSSTRCRVLVAEDQPQLLTLVERVLSNEGFPVIATADGDSALAALSVPGSLFGLMIVDAVMPGFPTNLLIERALSINPGCRVIVSSAHASDDRVLSEISAGARIHSLSKPFDVSQLREAVNVVLSRSA
jgi:CheY-like chemotaxis protein